MDLKYLEENLEGIRHLLSHLQSEVTALEVSYSKVLHVLRGVQGIANTDELSGLMRRGPLFDKWETLLNEYRRRERNCGVLLIDIDHFKMVNDTHGHPTGDEVIRSVAKLLKRFETPTCFSGRYGGEEFAVVVCGTDAEMLGIAEMIRRGAERLHGPVIGQNGKPLAKVEWKCTLSVGMASSRKVGYDVARLLRAADAALYEAKRRGRNRVAA